ncbi:hypothetical protein ABEB36_009803 [Hypothenemus hampei]|uniref:Uncharacterized protein n=1 Tax=Hypothenemus hampei TaxID=57062 RepID=A0ABD1EHI0_HYPHA
MNSKWSFNCLLVASMIVLTWALPSSLIEELKNNDVNSGHKVKRGQPDSGTSGPSAEENMINTNYFDKPTSAIKRGTNFQDKYLGDDLLDFGNGDDIQSGLFNSPLEDKSLNEYEKGYRYGTGKEKLDEALENAILKSDLLLDPYRRYNNRYYAIEDGDRRRKRSISNKNKRSKRTVDLTPEGMAALLSLYEKNHRSDPYEIADEDEDGAWLNEPVVRPHSSIENSVYNTRNLLDDIYHLKPRWGSNIDFNKYKRFPMAKKRTTDPTRIIRYLNGPSQNDFNTLSSILNSQKEIEIGVPVYRRPIL